MLLLNLSRPSFTSFVFCCIQERFSPGQPDNRKVSVHACVCNKNIKRDNSGTVNYLFCVSYSIPNKPCIKGKYWMIHKYQLVVIIQLGSYHPVIEFQTQSQSTTKSANVIKQLHSVFICLWSFLVL